MTPATVRNQIADAKFRQAAREAAAVLSPSWSSVIVRINGNAAPVSLLVYPEGQEESEKAQERETAEATARATAAENRWLEARRNRFPALGVDDCSDELSEICVEANELAERIEEFRERYADRHDGTKTANVLEAIAAACRLEWIVEGDPKEMAESWSRLIRAKLRARGFAVAADDGEPFALTVENEEEAGVAVA